MKLGEEILRCEPFVYVVGIDYKEKTCDFCLKANKVRPDGYTPSMKSCTACNFVRYCSRSCQKQAWKSHHRYECKYLDKVPQTTPESDWVRMMGRLITKLQNGGRDEVFKLPNGTELRFDDLPCEKFKEKTKKCWSKMSGFYEIMSCLLKCFKDKLPSLEEVFEIYCRLSGHHSMICSPKFFDAGMALYIETSVIKHSCRPNALLIPDGKTHSLRSIEENELKFEDVSIQLSDPLETTRLRRKYLKESYDIDCNCLGCQDVDGVDKLKESKLMLCQKCKHYIVIEEFDKNGNRNKFILKPACEKCNFTADQEMFDSFNRFNIALDCMDFPAFDQSNLPGMSEFYHVAKHYIHPYDLRYLEFLKLFFNMKAAERQCAVGFEVGKTILKACQKYLPKYHNYLPQLAMEVAAMAEKTGDYMAAKEYFIYSREIMDVTHGKDHSLYNCLPVLVDHWKV